MASLEERFQKGLEIRARLAGGEGRLFKGSVPVAYELAPDMYRITTECLYGAIWSRPGLDIRYRAMATVTVSAIQLATPQVRTHIRNALNVGITPEEIIEICMMITFYGGVPAAYNALAVTKEVFEERGMEPTDVEHELDMLMQEYLWGAIWTRPGLDMKSRIVCALASRVVKGQYDLSVRRMIEGALRCGLTKTEIMEIGIQLAFYVGILPARAFMHIANTVFRAPEFAHL